MDKKIKNKLIIVYIVIFILSFYVIRYSFGSFYSFNDKNVVKNKSISFFINNKFRSFNNLKLLNSNVGIKYYAKFGVIYDYEICFKTDKIYCFNPIDENKTMVSDLVNIFGEENCNNSPYIDDLFECTNNKNLSIRYGNDIGYLIVCNSPNIYDCDEGKKSYCFVDKYIRAACAMNK